MDEIAHAGPGMSLHKTLLLRTSGAADEGEGAVDQMRQEPIGDTGIELREFLFGDALILP